MDYRECERLDEELIKSLKLSAPDDNTISKMSKVFQALQSKSRLKILMILSKKSMCVCEMVYALGMSQSAISHSLRVLNYLELVRMDKRGKYTIYSLADEHIVTLINMCMEHITEQET